jgi:NADPH:quinone reductase
MRAIRVQQTGGPEVMRVEDLADPAPGEAQVRVRVEAAGVNFIDTYRRSGAYPVDLPMVPGSEAAGVVDAVGAGVEGLRPGDRVAGAAFDGAYAELAVAPADALVPVPDGIDAATAAATMLQGMTAHYLATDTVPLAEGMSALVYAAAGGVGRLLVQIAKQRGARVLATVSTDEKERLAVAAGADDVVRYREVDIAETVRALTDGRGVDVVYDSVGADTFDASLDCLRPRGTMVLYGQSSGKVPPVDPQVLNAKGSLYLTRPTLAHYSANRAELRRRAGDLFTWISAGWLEVRIDRTWPLEEAGAAHRHIEGGKTTGKLLLLP